MLYEFDDQDPTYIAYLKELDTMEERARERRGKPRPHKWGDPLRNNRYYFCNSCWDQGYEDGAHPYFEPPCDPLPRRDIG